jgi:hypothetical protein
MLWGASQFLLFDKIIKFNMSLRGTKQSQPLRLLRRSSSLRDAPRTQ